MHSVFAYLLDMDTFFGSRTMPLPPIKQNVQVAEVVCFSMCKLGFDV